MQFRESMRGLGRNLASANNLPYAEFLSEVNLK